MSEGVPRWRKFLNVPQRDNFANVAELDKYLEHHYQQYITAVRQSWNPEAKFSPSAEDMIEIITAHLWGTDQELYDHLDKARYPVREREKCRNKCRLFALVLVKEVEAAGG